MSHTENMNRILFNSIIGALFMVVGFFLVDFHNRVRVAETSIISVEKENAANKADIILATQLSKMKDDRFEEKIDDLKKAIIELTNELKSKK